MPSQTLQIALGTPWLKRPRSARFNPRHLLALGAALTVTTALLVVWPQPAPQATPMEPLLPTPVAGAERDWTLDFLRQSDTPHRLGRDGRIWVPQDRATTLRRQALALGLGQASAEPPRRSTAARPATRPQWGELKPE